MAAGVMRGIAGFAGMQPSPIALRYSAQSSGRRLGYSLSAAGNASAVQYAAQTKMLADLYASYLSSQQVVDQAATTSISQSGSFRFLVQRLSIASLLSGTKL